MDRKYQLNLLELIIDVLANRYFEDAEVYSYMRVIHSASATVDITASPEVGPELITDLHLRFNTPDNELFSFTVVPDLAADYLSVPHWFIQVWVAD